MQKGFINVNPNTLKKAELVQYLTGTCTHGHKYVEHPACFVREMEKELKIGYLDIEATGLEADYHHILSYVIKTRDKKEYYQGIITQEELLKLQFDKRVCKKLLKDMLRYDVLITFYGTGYDIPFIRARCLKWGLEFAQFGMVKHKDLYYMSRRLLKLHRKSLEVAANFLGIKGKDHVLGDVWMAARVGDAKALKYVLSHNITDAEITEKLHKKLEAYDKGLIKSI